MDAELLVKVENKIATLTINREKKQNSLSEEVLDLLSCSLDEFENSSKVRVIVITGAGEKAFCSGADISGFKNPKDIAKVNKKFARLLTRLTTYPKATLSRVNGLCMGGGIGLMLACDISLSHHACIFCTPEVNIGVFPLMISSLIFENVKSKKIANDMILSGRRISGVQAYEYGLLSQIYPSDDFESEVEKYITELSKKSSQIISFGKSSMAKVAGLPFDQAVIELSGALSEMITLEDAKEGVRAFMEKRPPNFKH
ncbi:MAG: enoyl-CoA hydratase/isomerase family protein [Bacteriovoracaceae bacterium]|jgi:enoyl-CoA hydratase/carnithine racemase|nr:enoyl-CoA hydratase/isomerase family protein [Bacteriovoracaceae bacterium]